MFDIQKIISFFVIFSISVSGIIKLQIPFINKTDQSISEEEYKKLEQKDSLQLSFFKRIPSLGFNNLIADITFLNFIQYYGNAEARNITGYNLIPDYYQIVVNRDPYFVTSHFILEPANTLFAGKPRLSAELISKTLDKVKPTQTLAYQLWLYKGILQILFLNDLEGAKYSYTMGANWARQENTENSLHSAVLAEATVKFLETEPDNRKITASAWLSIVVNARDEQTREIAKKQIDELGGKIIVEGNMIRVDFDN
ncbi:hypothetical protein ACN4EE_00095 [Geminocystis sp. CENA526]|uniref:hypothetical protein n=1 Tax=Geminocystis sp. CENA526 TaxID=1355871 RepID=UPI003D6E4CF2